MGTYLWFSCLLYQGLEVQTCWRSGVDTRTLRFPPNVKHSMGMVSGKNLMQEWKDQITFPRLVAFQMVEGTQTVRQIRWYEEVTRGSFQGRSHGGYIHCRRKRPLSERRFLHHQETVLTKSGAFPGRRRRYIRARLKTRIPRKSSHKQNSHWIRATKDRPGGCRSLNISDLHIWSKLRLYWKLAFITLYLRRAH